MMIGTTFSHYKIIERLSQGGMGTVYRAEDTKLKRVVALKLLSTNLTEDIIARQRFEREAQAAAALKHQNVITIYEIGEFEQQIYIAMEYVDGKSIREIIDEGSKDQSAMPLYHIAAIACQICDGLSMAHRLGIVHRDIKPGNLIIDPSGTAKILDFGLAKLKGASRLTKERSSLGTVYYMSPEQILGEDVDHRTDIWSLGVVLYEMITGDLPFKGVYEPEVVYFIANRKHKPMSELISDVPHNLVTIIERSLEKNRENRYQNIDDMKTDLVEVSKTLQGAVAIHQESASMQFSDFQHASTRHKIRNSPEAILRRIFSSTPLTKGAFLVSCAGVLTVLLLLYRSSLMKGYTLSKPTSIAIVSFENQTQEEAYDYLQAAIPNLLITSLEQSKYLRVTTWERLHDLLRQIGKENVDFIDENLGLELCLVDDIDIIVTGEFTKTDQSFTINTRLLDVETKRMVKSASSSGEGLGSILGKQIDILSREISQQAWTSNESVDIDRLPVAEVTTSSMDAYGFFLRGRSDWDKFYHEDARRFLERAVMFDSTFAVAHLFLARTHGALGNTADMVNSYMKARAYAENSTEKESLYIEADYAHLIELDSKKSMSIQKQLSNRFPREKQIHWNLAFFYRNMNKFPETINECNLALDLDPNYGMALNLLANTYAEMGEFNKAIEFYKRYAIVSPGDANPYDCLGETYLRMGKIDLSISTYKQALEVEPNFYESYWRIAYAYAVKEDYTEALKWMDRFISMAPSAGVKAEGYVLSAFYHYWLGNVSQSLVDLEHARCLASQVRNELWIAYANWIEGWMEYERGDLLSSGQHFKRWFDVMVKYPLPERSESLSSFYVSQYNVYLGLLELKSGQLDSVDVRLDVLESLLRNNVSPFSEWIEHMHSILLSEKLLLVPSGDTSLRGMNNKGLEMPQYMITRYILPYNIPFACDGLARHYLNEGNLDKAITEYRRLATPNTTNRDRRLVYPRYHYYLGKVYEEKGMLLDAANQYRIFLQLWMNADNTLPELIDAKRRWLMLNENRSEPHTSTDLLHPL